MKNIFVKYKLCILLLFSLCMALALAPLAEAAPEDFAVTVKYDASSIYEYRGNLYLSSVSSQSATMKYTITNTSGEAVSFSAVRVTETLLGLSYSYGNTTYDTDVITLEPGESYEVEGDNLRFDDASDFVFQYNIFVVYYSENEFGYANEYTEADFQSILSNDEILYITRDAVSLDVSYDYWMMQENIYVGDKVTIEFTVTSESNVPVRNIMVYDTVYGYIGQIDEIAPGETRSFSTQVTVTESTYSSPYLTYISLDSTQTLSRLDFENKIININVTYHNYFLGMEIKCEDMYIGRGQTVSLEFIVTNVGSGKIENIAVLDESSLVLFTIDSLEPGEIYTRMLGEVCNPNTTYKYTCISQQTDAVEYEISFMSLPGVSLSYMLDKDADEYQYMDAVIAVYTVTNNGSIAAENLILTDWGIDQNWVIGELAPGEQTSITYIGQITDAETVFQPNISGNYVDYDDGGINETADFTLITVELPEKYAEIEMIYFHTSDIIYEGDTVNFNFQFKNIGGCALMSYSVLIVEENMVIASEGKLDVGESKTFSAQILCNSSRRLTIRIEGRNQDTGERYIANFRADIEAEPAAIITPTPTASTTPTPTPTHGPSTPNNTDMMMIIVLIVGGIALILVVITVCVLVKGVVRNIKKKR